MRKIQVIVTSLLILWLVAVACAQTKTYKIGILMWHETLHDEQALTGFMKGIKLSGLSAELDLKRACGNETKAKEYLARWKNEKADLICVVGTKVAILALEEINDVPIVFTAVTNPVASGIANSWESSGRNVTGSSNWVGSEKLLKTFKIAIPHLKALGVIYDPNNPVTICEVSDAKKTGGSLGIILKEAYVKNVEQIESSIKHLIDQGIDALWVPIEASIYNNMDYVGRVTNPKKLPVVSSTLEGIGLGKQTETPVGIVAITVDYEALGRLCVPDVIEILTKGENPSDIPIKTLAFPQIVVNANAAEHIDYNLPPILLAEASRVLTGFAGQKIIVGGTGDSQVLLRTLAKTLTEELGGGEIEVPDSIGSSGGIKAVAKGEIDLARVSRPLKKKEDELGLTYRIFAKAAVVFAVHPGVTGLDNITDEQIIGIYSGKITDWRELGGQAGKIYPVTRESDDASVRVLNENLPGFSEISSPVAKIIFTTPETVATLAEHEKTIGFTTLPAIANTPLRVLRVNGIYPSAENVLNGKYKLVLPLGIVYKGQPKGLSKRFVEFLYSEESQKIITAMGAVPVR